MTNKGLPIKETPKPSAFDKRVKRRISGREHTFFAICPPGLKSLCQTELEALPNRLAGLRMAPSVPEIGDITPLPGGVHFVTRLETACLANLFLGTPTRILMRIADFKADRFPRLEQRIASIDWELLLPADTNDLNIQVTTHKSRLYHSDAVAERCRPLILERLAAGNAGLPSQVSGPTVAGMGQTLMVRADHDRFVLSLDMSGIPLFKRGIKQRVVRAPLRENLAFAILSQLGFSGADILTDPMCGSGTFSLEGAMILASAPPGLFRQFAFEAWPGFREKSFAHARAVVLNNLVTVPPGRIFASDLDRIAVENLDIALEAHPLFGCITTTPSDFFDIRPPDAPDGNGVVVLNPPYGRRLGKKTDMTAFFREIGKKLAMDFRGWRTGVVCPERHLADALGLNLRPMPIFHGGLDLYAGIGTIP